MTHLSVSEERRNGVSQRGKYREELLRSQQGELNAVLMYQRLAKGEYAAAVGYEHLIADFPEVESVKNDEKRHGDIVSGLL